MIQVEHIKKIWPHLVWQLLAAVLYMTAVLFSLGSVAKSEVIWAVGAGALSSSCCLVFAAPKSLVALPSRIVGGYIIGLATGLLVHAGFLFAFDHLAQHVVLSQHPQLFWMFSSVTVGLTMLLMVILGFEHPPAVGVSLVLVLDIHDYRMVWVILAFVILLAALRWLFNPVLETLL